MKSAIQKVLIGTSILAGMSLLGTGQALAGSLTGASMTGTGLIYESSGTTTYLGSDLQGALDGQGNVELGGYTTGSGTADFDNATVLSGTVDGLTATFSSLTATDWFGDDETTAYGEDDFANVWFNATLAAYGITDTGISQATYNLAYAQAYQSAPSFLTTAQKDAVATQAATTAQASAPTVGGLFDRFLADDGFQRFSDPNIQSVSSNGSGGLDVVLAGHLDGRSQFFSYLNSSELLAVNYMLGNQALQISEVVKVSYNGQTSYQYGYSATASGVVDPTDGVSHTGNYLLSQSVEVPEDPTGVPEPSTLFGLLTLGGLFAASKRQGNKA